MDGKNEEQRISNIINQETGWTTTNGHFNQNRPSIDDVHIMVPDISCLQAGVLSGTDIQRDRSSIQNGSELPVMHESLVTENNSSRDNLPAIGHPVELDQDRSECDKGILNGLPLAPFLKSADKEATFYNEIYHYICSKSFASKSSDSHKRIIKKRAANYMLTEDGRLVYGNKIPKKVVTDLEEQEYLIKSSHIVEETDAHVGVKKMQSYLSSNFHWKSMASDINNFIKNCEQCCKFFPSCDKSHTYQNKDCPPSNEIVATPAVWNKVVLHVHGPYKAPQKESKFVVSVSDIFSKWISATVLSSDDLERSSAAFLFDCFCSFGFARTEVVDESHVKIDRINYFLEEKLKILFKSLKKSEEIYLITSNNKSEEYNWIFKLIDEFCDQDDNWDESLSAKLFQYNTTLSGSNLSPFSMMFSRNHFSSGNGEEKENYDDVKSLETPSVRRRLRSSTLQCRHCYDTFTSKISFRIHQRRHTEDARLRGILDGEERICVLQEDKRSKLKKRRTIYNGNNRVLNITNTEWSDTEGKMIPSVMRSHLTQTTVEAVRNLLHATKEERNKRGKYFKYTPELRDQIAQYAMDQSIPAASVYWTDRLGSTVSESSIRNFMKAFKCFSASIKEEIGRYAFHNGIERAAVEYSEKLGFEIRKGIVLKFKKLYTRKVCEGNDGGSNTKRIAPCKQKRAFSFLMKEEIGRYAHLHGISAAIDYFSVKLQFSVKESTVRKFKRRYQERSNCGSEEMQHHPQSISTQDQGTSPNVEILHGGLPSTNCSNPSLSTGAANTPNNFIYQHSYPINMTPGAGMAHNGPPTVLPMNHNIAFHQGGVINQGVAALSYQQSPSTPTVIMNQSFASVTPSFQQSCMNNFSQVGSNVASGQGQPIAIAHTSLAPTAAHTNTPLQLTMGGQLTPVPVSHSHLLCHAPSVHHAPHHGQQIITSTFPNQIANSLPFDQGVQLGNHPSLNFTNEPINLLKESSNGVPIINHVCSLTNATHMQESSINSSQNVSNIVPTSIVQLSGNTLTQIGQSENHSAHAPGPSQQRNVNLSNKCVDDEYMDEEIGSMSEEEFSDSSTPPRKKHNSRKLSALKFTYGCGKRGNYVSYTPELRAEIGRYAAEHGNLEAIANFKEKIGLEIPESTVRGLKDKYLIKRYRGEKDVKTLGFGQRGRPMRLGKYDAVVQDCIKQLVKEGEKISSFLVIATAKQVLTQNEPSLLEENGGPVTLNPTWAKSFLKRIGIHQVS